MKYIDSLQLIGLNSYLNSIDVGDALLMGELEAYSCKMAGSDKKIYRSLDKELEELSNANSGAMNITNNSNNNNTNDNSNGSSSNNNNNNNTLSVSMNSPSPTSNISVSPFGPMSNSTSRKTMIYLIQLLNLSFPDYDFTDSKPEQFQKEPSLNLVINSINANLAGYIKDYYSEFEAKLWSTLESEISLQKCEIYLYKPENGDPFTENGVLYISKLQILNDDVKDPLPDQEELDDYYREYYDGDTIDNMEMS
ncbi:hypothetical protein ACTFIR_007888 [Dictyostelium discoideum]